MAAKIRGITVEIGGDTSGLDKALNNVNKEIKDTQKELGDVEKLLKLDPGNTELLAQKQELLADRVSQTSEKLELLHQAEQELKDAGIDENSSQFRALQREIISTENYLNDAKTAADNFSAGLAEAAAKADAVSEASGKVASATKGLSTAAAGVVTGLAGMAYNAALMSDDLNTLAAQTGLTTEEIQKMNYAQDLIDVSTDTMIGSIKKMTNTLKSNEKAFAKINVTTRNTDGTFRDTTEIWYDVLDALSKVENETERDTLAMEIFGKSAAELTGVIDDGGAALKELGDQAANTGLIMSQDTLDSLNQVNDKIDILKATATATIATTGAKALEVLTPVFEMVINKIGEVLEWIGNLDADQLKLIITIAAVVAAISPIAGIISSISGAVSGFLGFMPKVGTVASKIVAFAANNPIVLIAAAVAAITALIIANWDKIKPVLDNIWNKVKSIAEAIATKVTTVFNTVKNAVKSAINGVIAVINGLINGINNMIWSLNRFQINVPKWVPGLGGKSFGFDIGYIGNIPYLANGGVLENGSAIVGEAGPEILTMNQGKAVVQPLNSAIGNQLTNIENLLGASQPINITVQSILDGRLIGENTYQYAKTTNMRYGV